MNESPAADSPMIRLIRVFVSSPGDVQAEREVLEHVVAAINRTDGDRGGFRLELLKWEKDTVPQIGVSPQDGVNAQTPVYDIYLGIMATRFGTPTERAESGTEEEFQAALERWKSVGQPWIMFYFARVMEEIEDERTLKQFGKVLRFRSKLEKLGLVGRFKGVEGGNDAFRTQVDIHLRKVVHRLIDSVGIKTSKPRSAVLPAISSEYLEWLQRECADIDLLGMRLKEGQALRLTNIYVPLTTVTTDHRAETAERTLRREMNEPPTLLLELLNDRSLYVSGAPGAGKSTFARWAALLCCRGSLPPQLVEPPKEYRETFPESIRGRLPLLVRLRDFWGSLPNSPGCSELTLAQFESSLDRWLQVRKPGGLSWSDLEAYLGRGQVLLIFDGVDEVPQSAGEADRPTYYRTMLISGLTEAVAKWGPLGNRILVTSRPYGLTDTDRRRLGLPHAAIADLDEELRNLLVRRWFHILADDPGVGEKNAQDFQEHIDQRQDMEPLLANPMLLTALCIVYNEGRRLPKDRHELYARIVDNVLYNRFRTPTLMAMHRKQLCVVAHEMHTGEEVDPDRGTPLAEVSLADIDQALAAYQNRKMYTEEGFLGAMAAREKLLSDSGLLLPRDGERAAFYHLSIQEHLAAQWLLERKESELQGLFDQRARAPEWRNTLSFVFGALLARSEDPTKAVQLLEKLLDAMKLDDIRMHVVIADCLLILLGGNIRLRDAWQQKFRAACLAAIDGEVALTDRHVLGLALGWIGDPRIVVDLRDPKGYVTIPAGRYAYQEGMETIEQPFLLSRYPVTNGQYRLFVESGGYGKQQFWSSEGWQWREENEVQVPRFWHHGRWNAPSQPVVGVSWWEAEALCRWAGGFLPSERQWEAAARANQGRTFPWGDIWEDGICNSEESSLGQTSAVGIFPRSRTPDGGLEDMAGNVWEWCSDWYEVGVFRVIRGGCWSRPAWNCRSAYRFWFVPEFRLVYLGFRVARSLSGESGPGGAEPGA